MVKRGGILSLLPLIFLPESSRILLSNITKLIKIINHYQDLFSWKSLYKNMIDWLRNISIIREVPNRRKYTLLVPFLSFYIFLHLALVFTFCIWLAKKKIMIDTKNFYTNYKILYKNFTQFAPMFVIILFFWALVVNPKTDKTFK